MGETKKDKPPDGKGTKNGNCPGTGRGNLALRHIQRGHRPVIDPLTLSILGLPLPAPLWYPS